ncbi:ABC transporter permease [Risungbinella massiliensis]|uniref:ABC transporter permease n=1 Tax=Risungbinella massiliensis TaxID=1329796 RepID=UPI0005CB85E7|nr:ABC transporter permease [Risungbinella massiliensis]
MKILSKLNRQSSFWTSLLSVFIGLIIGAIAMIASGYDPLDAYGALFGSSLLQRYDLGETIRTISPLIFTGLAVAVAFRTGLFNIGVEGQFLVGQLTAVIIGLLIPLPPVAHAIISLIVGALAGALWASIPGVLKATRGVHEVIISIMMNFIALYLSNVLVRQVLAPGRDSTDRILDTASIRSPGLSELFEGARLHFGILLALLATILVSWLLFKSALGFQLRAVGYNPLAAEYAGIKVKKNIVASMMISGSLAGLAGATELLGTSEYLAIQDAFTGIGFDGIAVSLLGGNTPIGVVLASILFGVLTYGGGNMQFVAGVPFEVIRIVFAAIILLVAANISGKLFRAFRKKRGEANA